MDVILKFSVAFVITIAWMLGGDVFWGPYLVGAGGLACLFLAIRAFMAHGGSILEIWSWRALPWMLWLVLVSISLFNPSHRPKDPELAREFTQSSVTGKLDTTGFANPSVPVDHHDCLPTTSDVGRTAVYLLDSFGIMCLALALVVAPMRRKDVRIWLTVVFINGLILSLAGLFFHYQEEGRLLGFLDGGDLSPFATFRYKNLWTAYGILCAAIGVGLAFRSWKAGNAFMGGKSPTAFFAFATPFILLSFPVTHSRAGLLLSGLLIVWCMIVSFSTWVNARKKGRGSWLGLIAIGTAVIAMGWFGWQTLGAQVQDMLDRSEGELEQVEKDEPTGRMILIEDTWNMAKEKPWFGWGLATFAQIYPRFQNPRLYQLITFPGGEDFQWVPTYYQFAHCDWLQYAAETGFVGLFLLMATPLAWVFHCHRRGRRNPLTHWLHVGALLILFQAIFELPFASEAVALLFAACVALGGKYALLEEEARKSRRKTKRSRRSRSATEESEDDLPPGHVAT